MDRAPIAPRSFIFKALAALAGALTLAAPLALRAQTVDEFGSPTLKGAGSTFAHPLMSAWARDYRVFRNGGVAVVAAGGGLDDEIGGAALDYEAIGSQAGIQRVKTRAVDFAVSEMPLPADDLRRNSLVQVPLVAGAVAVAVNIEGQAAGELRLSPGVLVDIFLGRVKTWADPAIAQLNPGLKLPVAPIAVVHRADGSGTTYTFTVFLAQSSTDWKIQVGSNLLVNWPVGEGYKGNAGVARALQRTPNSIGYLDLVQALAAKLHVARLQNASGRFVAPGSASVQAAVASANWDPATHFNTSLVNMAGEDSYPIVAAVFGLASDRSDQRSKLARAFLKWSVTSGRSTSEKLGYVALPPSAVQKVEIALR
jgi:phosphate transport system substrate-binding protein